MSDADSADSKRGLRGLAVVCAVVGLVVLSEAVWIVAIGPKDTPATIDLGPPSYLSLVCNMNGAEPVYYVVIFPVTGVAGEVTTAQFQIGVDRANNDSIPPGEAAPAATPSLPCGAPPPPLSGWYAILAPSRTHDPVATFPSPSLAAPAGVGWSNSTWGGVPVVPNCHLILVFAADPTGEGNRLVARGIHGSSLELSGNTTFPGFHLP